MSENGIERTCLRIRHYHTFRQSILQERCKFLRFPLHNDPSYQCDHNSVFCDVLVLTRRWVRTGPEVSPNPSAPFWTLCFLLVSIWDTVRARKSRLWEISSPDFPLDCPADLWLREYFVYHEKSTLLKYKFLQSVWYQAECVGILLNHIAAPRSGHLKPRRYRQLAPSAGHIHWLWNFELRCSSATYSNIPEPYSIDEFLCGSEARLPNKERPRLRTRRVARKRCEKYRVWANAMGAICMFVISPFLNIHRDLTLDVWILDTWDGIDFFAKNNYQLDEPCYQPVRLQGYVELSRCWNTKEREDRGVVSKFIKFIIIDLICISSSIVVLFALSDRTSSSRRPSLAAPGIHSFIGFSFPSNNFTNVSDVFALAPHLASQRAPVRSPRPPRPRSIRLACSRGSRQHRFSRTRKDSVHRNRSCGYNVSLSSKRRIFIFVTDILSTVLHSAVHEQNLNLIGLREFSRRLRTAAQFISAVSILSVPTQFQPQRSNPAVKITGSRVGGIGPLLTFPIGKCASWRSPKRYLSSRIFERSLR